MPALLRTPILWISVAGILAASGLYFLWQYEAGARDAAERALADSEALRESEEQAYEIREKSLLTAVQALSEAIDRRDEVLAALEGQEARINEAISRSDDPCADRRVPDGMWSAYRRQTEADNETPPERTDP